MLDWKARLAEIDPRMLESSEGRRALCETDPMLFGLTYLSHHLKDDAGVISFGEHHFEWFEHSKRWMDPTPGLREYRDAYLAPRSSGKTTFWFLLLPLWWAAYKYSTFLAAFSDSGGQAELHLLTFKNELEENELLREDFPDLCAPKKRARGSVAGDAKNIRLCANGFIFMAKGADSSSLGMKIGAKRPDTILLDDIEPDEANYSLYQMEQRLKTVTDAILPLNERARVVLSGTVTMPGSITHQLVKKAADWVDEDNDFEWIEAANFRIHHQLPILEDIDGNTRSCWPNKWPLAYLELYKHTRDYQKNFLNNPMAVDSEYWTMDDIYYGDTEFCSSTILSIDGAVTATKDSDYTGLAVVGFSPRRKTSSGTQPPLCVVKYVRAVKMHGDPLRKLVMSILESFPEIRAILVETNQGGDRWLDTLHGMPVKIYTVHNKEKKESRAGRLLNLYQMHPPRVLHQKRFPPLEEQMINFPKGANDDLVDAVGNAVLMYQRPNRGPKAGIKVRQPR
jgi:phage terminase large subunit-like protein